MNNTRNRLAEFRLQTREIFNRVVVSVLGIIFWFWLIDYFGGSDYRPHLTPKIEEWLEERVCSPANAMFLIEFLSVYEILYYVWTTPRDTETNTAALWWAICAPIVWYRAIFAQEEKQQQRETLSK